MAKKEGKPLLNEGTIRRFMALAEIGGLSDNFVGDLYEQEEEEELPPPPPGLEAGAEEELPPEPGMEDEPPLEDPGAEMAPAPPEGGMGEEELKVSSNPFSVAMWRRVWQTSSTILSGETVS